MGANMRSNSANGLGDIWAAVLLLTIGPSLFATSLGLEEETCPVCGHRFEVRVVLSTNYSGGHDTDFHSRSSGFNPIVFFPQVCPSCCYAGYQEDFNSTAQISDSVVAVLGGQLAPCPGADPATSPRSWPPWVRYEQIYFTYGLRGKSPRELADACLRASWCVREVRSELPLLPDSLRSPANGSEKSIRGVVTGLDMFHEILSSPGKRDQTEVVAAMRLLRKYGENEHVLTLIPLMEKFLEEDVFERFRDSLRATIELERRYQRMAVKSLLDAAEVEEDLIELPILYYMIGELKRRLGDTAAATEYLNKTLKQDFVLEWLQNLTESQLTLIETDSR